MACAGRPRLAFSEPSSGSMTTRTPPSPKSTSPRSSLIAVKRKPSPCRRSSSAKTASSEAWSITSVRSPPSPRTPVSSRRSLLPGVSRRTRARASRATRHAPSQSASSAFSVDAMPTYPTVVLTPAQQRAVEDPPGPLLVVGGAGSGKTTVLVERFGRRVREGTPAESILVLAPRGADAALRERIEDALEEAWGELSVHDAHSLCARLLRDEAVEAGIDPLFVPATPADRLALLLDRVDELTLELHDFRGRPAALLAGVIERIDQLKHEAVLPADVARWAAALSCETDAERSRAAREREFAQLYADHDRLLAREGTLDHGDLLLHAVRLLRDKPHVRARLAARWPVLLVDDVQEAGFAEALLLRLLSAETRDVTVCGDDDQAIVRFRGAATKNLRDFADEHPDGTLVRLEESLRCPQRVLDAARAVVTPIGDRIGKDLHAERPGEVAFWRCANSRAQAQSVARDVERLVARSGVAPERIGVLVRSVESEGQAVAAALEERAVPHRVVGAAAFFQRAEVRDVLAWLRLLADPADAGAVVRALSRPPVDLRSVDLARCVQIARRRKLDMVSGLVAATESPQVTPEARERILQFLKL